MRLFKIGADGGLPEAQFNLGVMVGTGRGVPPDRNEAHRLFRLAAAAGNEAAKKALEDVQGMDD